MKYEIKEVFSPKLFSILKKYSRAQFAQDSLAGIIVGIVALLQSREHVYKLLLNDDFPATKLFEMFKVREVDGLIYTVLPLE